ncbi:amino acid ABC transporter substrate-binding protein [Rhizocola hellebori]|uniref:Amino acid ABC transporter substrate-binding protein n=1 Tax=Rhizocola hellebori TaxID=1392758 RepID=A0A8J3QCV9_9ACTN|nr:ABC transporter substrate-binding protein [Rhizocola hellebori]GIH07697.1 amino acid ABC transporter substrate-binding protein [Rhizocola hellebori]
MSPRPLRIAAVLIAVALAACAPQDEPSTPAASADTGCAPSKLATVAAGKLTVATDDPAYPPWVADNKPESGDGFESAVAYAVAAKLGYAKDQVVWTRVTFNSAIAPGRKAFDFDINQFSITEERRNAVDFSSAYYDVAQTVITIKGSKIDGAKTLAALKNAKLGAQVGTTSYRAITEVIKPATAPAVFNNNDDAKQQLGNGTVDGIVVDLPTAFFMTAAELDNGVIVGQVPQPSGQPEQFALVLDKGSPLTACVSRAVDALRQDGTLTSLQAKWLAGVSGAPTLG